MSGIWDWFIEMELKYQEEGDRPRLEMAQAHNQGFALGEKDPQGMIRKYREGRDKAKSLGEPWWTFLYDVWLAIAQQHYVGDLQAGLQQSLHCFNESRKPILHGHPWRLAAYNTLLICYIRIDPVGYARPIEQALDELSREIPPGPSEHRYVMMQHQREFLLYTGKIEEAKLVALRHLAMFEDDHVTGSWYVLKAYLDMCQIGWLEGDWDAVQSHAEQSEKMARGADKQEDVVQAELWQALAARKQGDHARGQRLFHAALNRSQLLQKSIYPEFFDARAWFHELDEDLEKALQIREEELKRIEGKGRYGYECEVQIKKCELLARLGRLTRHDLEQARTATHSLKNPQVYQGRIQLLEKQENVR